VTLNPNPKVSVDFGFPCVNDREARGVPPLLTL
jgi:hypothetical protein